MDKFIIDRDLAQAIANYLQTKPYIEVHQLIAGLVNLQPLSQQLQEILYQNQDAQIGTLKTVVEKQGEIIEEWKEYEHTGIKNGITNSTDEHDESNGDGKNEAS